MKHTYKILAFVMLALAFLMPSCKKYLDKKPDKALQIPNSLSDLQALLDDGYLLNGTNGVSFDEASADDYYVPDDLYNDLSVNNRNAYLWRNTDYTNYPNDWGYIYNVVNIANIVLNNIQEIEITALNKNEWNNIKGSALFHRSFAFLQGASIFCKAYDDNTSAQDYGLVLRLTSDITLPSVRASVKDTYNRIIEDLKSAVPLLPDLPKHVLRPSKNSAYALLSRIYLSMRKYDSCAKYANLSLLLKSELLDYNAVNVTDFVPFERFNAEVQFHNIINQPNYASIDPYYARVDSVLYGSYANDDLRKEAFFYQASPGYTFKGSYSPYQLFTGLATDEVYLMRAESYARLGDKDAALLDLNTLLVKRWKTGTFIPFTASTASEALSIILMERRKQLLFRNLRWMDIKRLNKEGGNIVLKRVMGGETYSLQPNDNKYALSLPTDIINMTGMQQNPH